MRRAMILAVFALGCAGEDDTECSNEDQLGSYRVTFTETGGNCGDYDPAILQFRVEDRTGLACIPTRGDDTRSGPDCETVARYVCNEMEIVGLEITFDPSGRSFSGTGTVENFGQCESTYDVVGRK